MQSHQMKRAAGNSAPTDPNFKQTVLLLHGDGTNGGQNNTFIDSSTNNFTITRNGNTTQGTFSPFSQSDGYWSNYFDGVGDQLSFTDSSNNFDLGGAVKSLEFWFFPNAQGTQVLFGKHGGVSSWSTANGFEYQVQYTGGILYFYYNSGGSPIAVTDSVTRSAAQWFYIAVATDASNNISFYINGSRVATATSAITKPTTRTSMLIGNDLGGNGTVGYISNLRFINGTGAINPSSSTIAVPSVPLTAVTNTILLTCLSNRFVDKSSSPFTLTSGGNTAVTAFSPFAPTAAYVASTNGGSGYFDGAGDYLSVANSSLLDFASTFSLEFWIYRLNGNNQIFISRGGGAASWSATNGLQYACFIESSTLYFQYNNGGGAETLFSTATLPGLNSWTHIAVARNGTTTRGWVNGTSLGTSTTATVVPTTTNLTYIGTGVHRSDYPYAGYISSVRFVQGAAAYDASSSTITVPTSPTTAITNTQLLCNFTNAAIYDNTGKNDLETVGNAQISTSVVKYGTGSMYFDGTGDYIVMRNNDNFQFGTGNFTIEFWLYASNASSTHGLIAASLTGSGYWASLISSNTLYWQSVNGTTNLVSTSYSSYYNQWVHVAFVRNSGTTYIYLNGVSAASAADTYNYNGPSGNYEIGRDNDNSAYLTGYIDDLRITKGVARYTANFTVPARAFPDK